MFIFSIAVTMNFRNVGHEGFWKVGEGSETIVVVDYNQLYFWGTLASAGWL